MGKIIKMMCNDSEITHLTIIIFINFLNLNTYKTKGMEDVF